MQQEINPTIQSLEEAWSDWSDYWNEIIKQFEEKIGEHDGARRSKNILEKEN